MVTLAGINLSEAIWEDEFAYSPIDQNVRYTLGGKPIIQTAMRNSGRPIILRCQWVSLADLRQLELLRDQPNTVMDLLLSDGRSFATSFRHSDNPPLDVAPIVERPSYDDSDYFDVTVKVIQV